jgi:predicted small metal-binding protein
MSVGKTLLCDCGYEVRAADDAALVDAIRRHAQEAHGIEFTLELALDVARGAQLAGDETIGEEKQ